MVRSFLYICSVIVLKFFKSGSVVYIILRGFVVPIELKFYSVFKIGFSIIVDRKYRGGGAARLNLGLLYDESMGVEHKGDMRHGGQVLYNTSTS